MPLKYYQINLKSKHYHNIFIINIARVPHLFQKLISKNLIINNYQTTQQRGNILVTSILILLVMNLLGIGIANLATKQWSVSNYKSIDSGVFQTTDICSQDVKLWFETQTATPSTINDFSGSNSTAYSYVQGHTSDISNKLSGYSYSCDVAYINSKEAASSITSGTEIGNSGGSYGNSGNTVIKDYYEITSTGSGPKSASKTTHTIISVEY